MNRHPYGHEVPPRRSPVPARYQTQGAAEGSGDAHALQQRVNRRRDEGNPAVVQAHAAVIGGAMLCAALVKPGTALASRLRAELPAWGIFELCPALGIRELRFGDGSAVAIDTNDMAALELLPQLGDAWLGEVFA